MNILFTSKSIFMCFHLSFAFFFFLNSIFFHRSLNEIVYVVIFTSFTLFFLFVIYNFFFLFVCMRESFFSLCLVCLVSIHLLWLLNQNRCAHLCNETILAGLGRMCFHINKTEHAINVNSCALEIGTEWHCVFNFQVIDRN